MVADRTVGTKDIYDSETSRNTWSELSVESDTKSIISEQREEEINDADSKGYEEENKSGLDTEDGTKADIEEKVEEDKQEEFYEEYDQLVDSYDGTQSADHRDRQDGRRCVPRIGSRNRILRNPTWFKEEHVFGSMKFKGQCIYDWMELPFTMDGKFDPSMLHGNTIPAMSFNRYGECEMDYVAMKYMDSPLDRLAHYLDAQLYGADLEFIEKIILIQDSSFEIQISVFWKFPRSGHGHSPHYVEVFEERHNTIIFLRHNLLAPEVFAPCTCRQRSMIREYMRHNAEIYWNVEPCNQIE
ncbi:hypothetical protein M422DRAFT_265241 [Sphaerobolus stellatus SS14]|uniref:Uncharacterized protein n=1 Tax=Sphaerobolus stellatus (strain SS14) TaxID=990650 RepID=A0A0C9UUK2_SPHS4|nr:hypothetical protein M422DRAFT_265241 [Sphaerobolus stellatus SS14]